VENEFGSTLRLKDWRIIIRILLVIMYFIAGMFFLSTPFFAFAWEKLPFPGLVLEQTNLVGSHNGASWEARIKIEALQRVVAINDQPLHEEKEYREILAELSTGDRIDLVIQDDRGSISRLQDILLVDYPKEDFFRLFWLPYGIGILYLVLGISVAIKRGNKSSGQVFAYFCVSIAVSIVLLFDLISTHQWVNYWSTAIAQIGGAASLLAFTFPEPLPLLAKKRWLYALPITLSFILTLWSWVKNYDLAQPWAYVLAWRLSFLYAILGVLLFFSVLIYRLRHNSSAEEIQQVRITLWGGFFAFSPVLIWLSSPFFGEQLIWDPALFLPLLIIFPVTISAAIVRYRLWDLEVIINRTLVYSLLTLVLGGIFISVILGSQLIFVGIIKRVTVASVALSSILVTLLFNPLRIRIQNFIDQSFFRHKYDVTQALVAFQTSVRDTIQLDALTNGLYTVIQNTMQPTTVTLCTCNTEVQGLHFTINDPLRGILMESHDVVEIGKLSIESSALNILRAGQYILTIPLVNQGELIGVINLGPKRSGQPYTVDDRRFLMILAAQIAPALRIANLVHQYQEKVIEQERIRQELEIARLIQQSLLPQKLPEIPGWEIAVHYQPARAVGGDFYDFFHDGDKLVIVIGDVTDKGVPAALVMATTRSVLRGTARRRLSPGEALRQANEILVPEMFKSMFVTCFYLILELKTGRIIFANAGHNLPLHHTKERVVEFYATGMPLGLMEKMVYEEYETFIRSGDSVLLFSDGLVEAHNKDFEMFGEQHLEEIVHRVISPNEMIETLKSAIQKHSERLLDPEDDITLLCFHRQ
jgi:serine phosphatase RsbU (regulator of sigma subunit)